MSNYLIEQIAALPNIDVRTGAEAVEAIGEDGHLKALKIRGADGSETVEDADACFVFVGAAPRTSWLDEVVARDEHGFILAGADVRGAGWPLKRDPYLLETSRPRRLRRRRRPRPLDQAGGQRRRRRVDGRLAHPRVLGGRMTTQSRTAEKSIVKRSAA